jgi:nicotinamidase/pyrazinamidase
VKTVFFDVDTQFDFLYAAGALYVPGAEQVVPALGALTRYAAARGIQIVSTADAHAENDVEFKTWNPHCVAGTLGQQRASATKLPGAITLGQGTDSSANQIIVEKQVLDPFADPKLQLLLDGIDAERYVLYGVVTEICVRCAAIGLLATGARVELVTDAVKSLSSAEEGSFVNQFQASGGFLTSSAAVLSE